MDNTTLSQRQTDTQTKLDDLNTQLTDLATNYNTSANTLVEERLRLEGEQRLLTELVSATQPTE